LITRARSCAALKPVLGTKIDGCGRLLAESDRDGKRTSSNVELSRPKHLGKSYEPTGHFRRHRRNSREASTMRSHCVYGATTVPFYLKSDRLKDICAGRSGWVRRISLRTHGRHMAPGSRCWPGLERGYGLVGRHKTYWSIRSAGRFAFRFNPLILRQAVNRTFGSADRRCDCVGVPRGRGCHQPIGRRLDHLYSQFGVSTRPNGRHDRGSARVAAHREAQRPGSDVAGFSGEILLGMTTASSRCKNRRTTAMSPSFWTTTWSGDGRSVERFGQGDVSEH